MNKKLVMTLLLTCALGSGFADSGKVSTLAERADLIKSAGSDKDKITAAVNKKQQDGEIKVDEKNYIVVLKKDGDGYIRVAHFKKEQLDKRVETVLLSIIKDAEGALKSGDGPARIQFNADGKQMYAVVSRCNDLLIFNMCDDERQVNSLLPEEKAPEVKQEEKKHEDKKPEAKQEEKKSDDKKEKPSQDVDDKPKGDIPSPKTDEVSVPKEDEDKSKKSEQEASPAKENTQN